jgi:glycosyltransferase involved in cell wall biosynthesis
MNILFIGGQDFPGIGGIESYMHNISISLLRKGHNVTIISKGKVENRISVDGIVVINKKCSGHGLLSWLLFKFKALKYIIVNRRNIDIVNDHIGTFSYIVKPVLKMFGSKVCFTMHSFAKDSTKYGNFQRKLLSLNSKIAMRVIGDDIITVSKSKANEIKKQYGSVPQIIPCGINIYNKIDSYKILDDHHITVGNYFLTISRIDPIKNLDVLILAFKKTNIKDKQLVIAGDYNNYYGKELRELAKDSKNIIFVGSVIGTDKEILLQNCYANCLLSSSEGMPIALLEAMAYAKPCIVTDIPAIREILQDDWGYWCKVRNVDDTCMQLLSIVSDDQKNNNQEIKEYVTREHSWDNIAEKFLNHLYAKYLN